MNVNDENIQELQFLLKEVTLQMELLAAKKAEMELSINGYDQEIIGLKQKQHELGQHIGKLLTPKDYIWANIGDGG